MDTITHGLIGAAVGAALADKESRRRAAILGAVVGASPDADLLFPVRHRAETHSFFYIALAAPVIGVIAKKFLWAKSSMSWRLLTAIAFLALFFHAMLDYFTSYGTRLWLPFSDRISVYDALPIIDFSFSLPLFALGIFLLFKHEQWRKWQRLAAIGGVLWFFGYIAAGVFFSQRALAIEPLRGNGFLKRVTPLAGTIFLWRGVKLDGREATVLYIDALRRRVLFSEKLYSMDSPRTRALAASPLLADWRERSRGLYLTTEENGAVYFRDLRYSSLSAPSQLLFAVRGIFNERGEVIGVERERVGKRSFSAQALFTEMKWIFLTLRTGKIPSSADDAR